MISSIFPRCTQSVGRPSLLPAVWLLAMWLQVGAATAADAPAYPREITLPGGKVTVHHPTVSDWQDFSVLSAWVPVEIEPAGSPPWTGSVMVQAVTEIRFDERVVLLDGLRPVKAVADETMPEAVASLKNSPGAYPLLQEALGQAQTTVSLEYLLRALPADFADTLPQPAPPRQQDVPDIIFSEQPAVLVLFDGPPQTVPIRNSRLEIAVNTSWPLFHDTSDDYWYLVFGDYWLRNSSLSGGTWEVAAQLPQDIANLAMANGWESMRKILPPKQTERRPPPLKLSYKPAELVIFDGPPDLQVLPGTELQYVTNTAHDLFRYQESWYILLAGRWFSARDLKGNWAYAEELPAEFTRIPASGDKAWVLAAVPGTEENRIALIESALPRSQRVANDSGSGIQVRYDGAPQFVWINGVLVERAVNTPSQVLRHNDNYYLCQDAAWFRSDSATGPWKPALEIPDDIYSIPPDDPAHNVTFVKLGGLDNNTGRQAYIHTYGYSGTYTADKGLIKGYGPTGSGKYYDPTYDPRQRDPYFWSTFGYGGYWPPYGYGARYYPWAGGWRYGGWYDPFWGNPYPYPVSTSIDLDVPEGDKDWVMDDEGRKHEVVIRQDHNYVDAGGYRVSAAPAATATEDGALYATPDGGLYRLGANGWQVRQGDAWLTVAGPVPDSVLREYQARQSGYASYQQYQQEKEAGN